MDPNEEERLRRERDQQAHQSGIDGANNALNKTRSTRNYYKGLKGANDLLKKARAARTAVATGQTLAATSEFWIPILLILLLLGLIVVIVVVFLSGTPTVNGGIGLPEPTPVATGSAGLCTDIPNQFCNDIACGSDKPPTVQGKGTCSSPTARHCCSNFVYYCQYGGWNTSTCDIAGGGCTPTSIAMIMSTFGDTKYTPIYTAKNITAGQGCDGNVGTGSLIGASKFIMTNIKNQGYAIGPVLAYGGGQFNMTLAKKYLDSGYLIINQAVVYFASHQRLEQHGHSFVITSVDPAAGTAFAYDPTFCGYEPGYETKSRTFDVRHASSANCPTFAVNSSASTAPGNKICRWYAAIPIKKL